MMSPEEELQSRSGCDERYTGWQQCSMCGKHFLPDNNGDGKSPCCTADPADEEDEEDEEDWWCFECDEYRCKHGLCRNCEGCEICDPDIFEDDLEGLH